MTALKRKGSQSLRVEPQGPLGHLINDALIRRGRLGRDRAATLINQAAAREGEHASYDRSSMRNWIGRRVVPRADTLRWIGQALDIPLPALAAAATATEDQRSAHVTAGPADYQPTHAPTHACDPNDITSPPTAHHKDDDIYRSSPQSTRGGELPYYVWDMKRRQFLRAGSTAILMSAFSSLPVDPYDSLMPSVFHDSHVTIDINALDTYWQLVEQCWALCNAGQLDAVDHIIQGFLPDVLTHATDRAAIAALAAQSLRLLSVVRTHQLRLHEKVALNQQAVEYARQANDPTMLVAALTELAVAFKYADQPENSFGTYLEAVAQADKAAPLVRSRAYAATAAAFAQRSRLKEAATYISRAHNAFPANPEREPGWLSADYGIWLLSFYEGLTQMQAGNAAAADAAFMSYEQHASAGLAPERNRLEVINHLARTAIMAGDLDSFAHHLHAAIIGAGAIHSRKRLDEAVAIYRYETPAAWRQDPQVKQIEDMLSPLRPQ